jgi:hypothetical protein
MLRHDIGLRIVDSSKNSINTSSPENGPNASGSNGSNMREKQNCGCEPHSLFIFFFIRWTLFRLNRIIAILHLHKELFSMKQLEVTPLIDELSENLDEHIEDEFFQGRDPWLL